MINRKTFLGNTALAAGGLLFSLLDAFARHPLSSTREVLPADERLPAGEGLHPTGEGLHPSADESRPASDGYQLKIMATNWGFNGSMEEFCAKAKEAGYDGIETVWPADSRQQEEIFTA